MGEWARAREAVHEAMTPEARDEALDRFRDLANRNSHDVACDAVDTVFRGLERFCEQHPNYGGVLTMFVESVKHELWWQMASDGVRGCTPSKRESE